MNTTTTHSPQSTPATGRRPNHWLILLRQLHGYLGLLMALFILLVSFTGIWLNHKHAIGNALGMPEPVRGKQQQQQQPSQSQNPSSPAFSASSNATVSEGSSPNKIAEPANASPSNTSTNSPQKKSLGKIMHDLHTGAIIGFPGTLLSDAVGLVMMFLTLSGVYMWWIPVWRKMPGDWNALRARFTRREHVSSSSPTVPSARA